MSILGCAPFYSELGPGNVTIGFSAQKYIGYSNSHPNWRQESVFYEHLIIFPRSPYIHWAFLEKSKEFQGIFPGSGVSDSHSLTHGFLIRRPGVYVEHL